jgi:hypothetical protein
MPHVATDADVSAATAVLKATGLTHLRCRKRASTIVIESGPSRDAIPHIRFRKLGVHIWAADAATHTGRWEHMPVRGKLSDNLQLIADTFSWLLAPRE